MYSVMYIRIYFIHSSALALGTPDNTNGWFFQVKEYLQTLLQYVPHHNRSKFEVCYHLWICSVIKSIIIKLQINTLSWPNSALQHGSCAIAQWLCTDLYHNCNLSKKHLVYFYMLLCRQCKQTRSQLYEGKYYSSIEVLICLPAWLRQLVACRWTADSTPVSHMIVSKILGWLK
jgi:hypothetical protein